MKSKRTALEGVALICFLVGVILSAANWGFYMIPILLCSFILGWLIAMKN